MKPKILFTFSLIVTFEMSSRGYEAERKGSNWLNKKQKKKKKTRWMCEHNEVVYTFSEPLRFGTSLLSIFPNTFMQY